MSTWLLVALAIAAIAGGYVQAAPWSAPKGHTQVPIWPGAVPDAQPAPGQEEATLVTNRPVAGKSWTNVTNVSRPTMTVFFPKKVNTGAAVVVFPGGGFITLAIDLEGTEICDWLTAQGMTCVLLKYRVPRSGQYYDEQSNRVITPKVFTALEDAQRTVGLVRFHAAEWHVNPHKIGVLGFSAGGYMVAAISTHFATRLYPAVDAADKESCRPDFAAAIYPGHLNFGRGMLNPDVPISKKMPPEFLVQAEDDDVDGVEQALVYYTALAKAGVPAEMHLYAHGGHAFGLRSTTLPITGWPRVMETWLKTIGILSPSP
jgi:acetyl esterase/lipase